MRFGRKPLLNKRTLYLIGTTKYSEELFTKLPRNSTTMECDDVCCSAETIRQLVEYNRSGNIFACTYRILEEPIYGPVDIAEPVSVIYNIFLDFLFDQIVIQIEGIQQRCDLDYGIEQKVVTPLQFFKDKFDIL